jgi:dTDP-4-dehydrorhamnose reductase
VDAVSHLLILGASGMLGRAWVSLATERGIPFAAASRPSFDLARPESIDATLRAGFTAVIHCAAYTDVDGAEADEATATEINGHGVGRLVERCDALKVPLVHYSTDYVFDGNATSPYAVDHPTDPINAYGRSKLVGEERVRASSGPHLLIRTSWVYAPWGKNFVRTIAKLALERESLRVVNDQRGRPSSAEQLARSSLALLEAGQQGTFHATDGGECTWFDFATAIAAAVNPSCRVEPCTSAEFPRPAKRPAYSVLDVSRTEAVIGPLTPWREALADVLGRLG